MKVFYYIIMMVCLVFHFGCSVPTQKKYGPLEADYYLSPDKIEVLAMQAQGGDFEAAYKLALYELYFGQRSEALVWFQLASRQGYKREDSIYLSVFENISNENMQYEN